MPPGTRHAGRRPDGNQGQAVPPAPPDTRPGVCTRRQGTEAAQPTGPTASMTAHTPLCPMHQQMPELVHRGQVQLLLLIPELDLKLGLGPTLCILSTFAESGINPIKTCRRHGEAAAPRQHHHVAHVMAGTTDTEGYAWIAAEDLLPTDKKFYASGSSLTTHRRHLESDRHMNAYLDIVTKHGLVNKLPAEHQRQLVEQRAIELQQLPFSMTAFTEQLIKVFVTNDLVTLASVTVLADVKTRWDSVLYMLRCLRYLQQPVVRFLALNHNANKLCHPLENKHWSRLELMELILQICVFWAVWEVPAVYIDV
ncbi:hypothetical protein FB451DRAFT_1194759 [Mycena latifolia]|nr:hypothetical protein FB451DRAFT_1194759 [Mycena latifolia]